MISLHFNLRLQFRCTLYELFPICFTSHVIYKWNTCRTEYDIVLHNLKKTFIRSLILYLNIFYDQQVSLQWNSTLPALFFKSLFTFFFHNSEVIYRLSFPIFVLFTGSLFDFHFIYRVPFSISVLITGSLFQFPCYIPAPFSIYVLFTGFLFRFTCYFQAPFSGF